LTEPLIGGWMMDSTAATSPETFEPDAATYNAFIAGLELVDIELVKVGGERVATGVATQTRFDLAASYLQDEATIRYRYDATARLMNEADTDLGHAAVSVMVTTRIAAAAEAICVERFGGTSGALMAHPYLREAIASTAQRLGFPGVLLPMIKYQPDAPTSPAVEIPDAADDTQVDASSEE